MFAIDMLFIWLLKYLLITFAILGIAVILLRSLWQPVEKVSLIRITFTSLVAALLVSSIGWLPKIELEWLPAKSGQVAVNNTNTASNNSFQRTETSSSHFQFPAEENNRSVADSSASTSGPERVSTAPVTWDVPPSPATLPTENSSSLGFLASNTFCQQNRICMGGAPHLMCPTVLRHCGLFDDSEVVGKFKGT